MREKKKMVASLKEQLKEMKMTSAVDVRYQGKGSTAKNEHLSRLEQTQLEEMRKELTLVGCVVSMGKRMCMKYMHEVIFSLAAFRSSSRLRLRPTFTRPQRSFSVTFRPASRNRASTGEGGVMMT